MILAQEEYYAKVLESSRSFWKDVTLYVTIEPCVMCASALRQLGMYRMIGALFAPCPMNAMLNGDVI
jgi:tRNA(Arg) A34 adenosine deaminase TadA